jgi:hypothetical protein
MVGNTPFERSVRKYVVRMYVGWIRLSVVGSCEPSDPITGVKFVQQISHYHLLKKVSVHFIWLIPGTNLAAMPYKYSWH